MAGRSDVSAPNVVAMSADRHSPGRLCHLLIEDDGWGYDSARWQLIAPNGRKAQLSLIESQLVRCLFSRSGEVVTREELLEALHRPCLEAFRRNLDVTVSRLRKKVAASCEWQLPISSARGQGYVFSAPATVIR